MKNGGSSAASAAGGGGLAIAERQKAAPSCVAALFQMLAKRKLFSSSSKKTKLLPPVRPQKFSPGRPPGGGEKTPAAKKRPLLLDSADYARSRSEGHGTSSLPSPSEDRNHSEMCTPGVVARLMGLSSMPSISHERSASTSDSAEVGDHGNGCSQGLPGNSGSMGTSHQKQQKPGQLRDERHNNGSQFDKNAQVLWSGRHHHKVASPLKSPRSISSRNKARLMEAAARVLEPGLQNRHRAQRHARLEYPCNGAGVEGTGVESADKPISGSRNVGATYTSSQLSEENVKKIAAARRPNQNVSLQVQPEGKSKTLPVSSLSKKARCKESDAMISNASADTYHDVREIQPRNIYRGNVACSPLKQNNLKQNTLPIISRTGDPGHMVQGQKPRTGEQYVANTAKNFVSLNKSMNSGTSSRSKGKELDKIGVSCSSAEDKNSSTKGHRTSGLRSDCSNKQKVRTTSPKAMEKDMIIAKGAGLVSEKPKTASPNCVRRQVELHNAPRCNGSDIVSFTFSSPMKAIPTSLLGDNTRGKGSSVLESPNGSYPKKNSHRDCQNISSQRELVFREILQSKSSMEAVESVCFNRYELKNIDIPDHRVTSSLFEKRSDLPVTEKSLFGEFLWELDGLIYGFGELPNPVESRETHKKPEANRKSSNPSRSVPGSNRQRGILQSTYADEDFTSGNLNYTLPEAQIKERRCSETSAPPFSAQDADTKRSSRHDEPNFGQPGVHHHRLELAVEHSKPLHPGEVTSTVELLLASLCSSGLQKPRTAAKTFLLRTSESALAKNNSFKVAGGANPLRDLAFDFVTECLDMMCVQLCGWGYRSFSKLAMVCTEEERLAAEVRKEVVRHSAMAGKALDELATGDVERTFETGVADEAFRIGAQIERDLLQELVDEIWWDMLKPLQCM